MVTKSTEDANAEFAAAIEESVAEADANAPATEEEVVVEAEVEEEESGFLIFKANAEDAIAYLREATDKDEVYALAQAEEKGKSRKTVIEAAMRRVTELNLLEDEARAEAAPPAEDEPALEAPALDEPTAEVAPPVDMGEPDEYPVEGSSWEGDLGRYSEIKHITRTMNPLGGLDDRVMTPNRVNEYIEGHFLDGFELIKVVPQGFGQQGLSLLWVLGKVRADEKPRFTEIWHIQRTLTESPMTEGGSNRVSSGPIPQLVSAGWLATFCRTVPEDWRTRDTDVVGNGSMTIVSMAVLGRLLVWVLQTSGPTKRVWDLHPYLMELGECDFCMGCWVYLPLAYLFKVNLMAPLYYPGVSEFVTGIAFAFVAHLATIGWRAKWGYEVLE